MEINDSKLKLRRKITVQFISQQAHKISDEHEQFLNKVTYCLGVFCFGTVCYVMGSRPHEIPYLYCLFFLGIAPLRWVYYRMRKWHYYLLDFCYYANVIFMTMLLVFPNNEKLFMVCFSFSEGPLAWALIVWRCSLVFNSIDKIISVFIHLLPGTVFFIIRWWDPITFPRHAVDATVNNSTVLWTWLFFVPLAAYTVWQMLYLLIVNVLRKQRLLKDPEIMTSFRELSRKAARANNIWWQLSGILGDSNRVLMYAVIQAVFTVVTMALTVPMFKSYRVHVVFEIFKATVAIWNGGIWLFDVMPRQNESKSRMVNAGIFSLDANIHCENISSGVTRAERSTICSLCKKLCLDDEVQKRTGEVCTLEKYTFVEQPKEIPCLS